MSVQAVPPVNLQPTGKGVNESEKRQTDFFHIRVKKGRLFKVEQIIVDKTVIIGIRLEREEK